MAAFQPIVMLNYHGDGVLIFGKGRTKYHAVEADGSVVHIVKLDNLKYLRPAERKGKPYPVRRAASFWLNHSTRTITKRAKQVLRGLVARKQPSEE